MATLMNSPIRAPPFAAHHTPVTSSGRDELEVLGLAA
jgi:hypothetical protein